MRPYKIFLLCQFFLLVFFTSCLPNSSDKALSGAQGKTAKVHAALQDMSSLTIGKMKLSTIEEGGNSYPQIEFEKASAGDYTRYSFCSASGDCSSNITLNDEVVYYGELGADFSVSVSACLGANSSPQGRETCGEASTLEGTIDQEGNSSESSELITKKESLVNLLKASGFEFLKVVESYREDFPSCLSEKPSASLIISDDDYKTMSSMDPMLLGEAIYLLIEELTAGDSVDEDGKYNGTSDIVNLIFGVTGLAAGVGIIVDTFAKQSKMNHKTLHELKALKAQGIDLDSKNLSDVSAKIKNKNFEARIKDLEVDSIDTKAKFTDLSMGDKFKVIGVGAVGAALFAGMAALSIGNMSEGYGLSGSEDLCEVEEIFLEELQDLGSKVTLIIDKIKEIEIELLLFEN